MSQIEKGCLAIVVNSLAGNDGIVVTVLEYVGEDIEDSLGYRQGRIWQIDKNLRTVDEDTKEFLEYDDIIQERQLRRIDGYEPTQKESNEKVYLTPNTTKENSYEI